MSTQITRRKVIGATVTGVSAAGLLAHSSAAVQAQGLRIAVIGSGYGGAVAALRLAKAGKTLDLIEMGADWESMPAQDGLVFTRMAAPSERSMWFKTKTDMPFSKIFGIEIINRKIKPAAGVLDVENFGFMKVYVGRGVGGGSLVNGGMAVTPSQSFFKKVLPRVDADQMYRTYFPRALQELKVSDPPKDFVGSSKFYEFTRVGAAQAAKAGIKSRFIPNVYDWDYMRLESFKREPRSGLAGQVIFGNDYGKRSLPKTILAQARATGKVRLKALTEVEQIFRQKNGTFKLKLKTIDFTGKVLKTEEKIYDRVILAAGSTGTSKLLLKARQSGSIDGLPPETGKKWGPNGNIMLARYAKENTGTYQSGIPAMGISNWDDSPASVFAELAPFPIGIELRTSLYLAISNNDRLGEFSWDEQAKAVKLSWTQQDSAPSVAAVKNFFDRINASNAGSSYRSDLFADQKIFSDYFTYHPLGGMVLGEATDLNGEVKGVPGLFVMDGSLIPGKIGVNPFVTITALAERNMDRLLSIGRFG
ncbi:MAG: GMC oxidoreductase [Rothia sp. (in: high G+C Gram-positive bacteria)]|nr:GMC oxidoreductase [Rothia sp. (in: high G+C Gram-positive bacteria)]